MAATGGVEARPLLSLRVMTSKTCMSVGVCSGPLGFTVEKDVYRSKDLSFIKIETLPTTASEFKAFASIDQAGMDFIFGLGHASIHRRQKTHRTLMRVVFCRVWTPTLDPS